jgi:hypothetical protein
LRPTTGKTYLTERAVGVGVAFGLALGDGEADGDGVVLLERGITGVAATQLGVG